MANIQRASVCFPSTLHTQIKMRIAAAGPTATLTTFVAGIIAESAGVSDENLRGAFLALTGKAPTRRGMIAKDATRSTIMLSGALAKQLKARAEQLHMSRSAFIVAAVAHHLA